MAEELLADRASTYGRTDDQPTPRWAWFALSSIVLAGLLVRIPGLGAPIVGYHSFNEAFYLDIASRYLHMNLLVPWTAPLEPNNPPFYPFLLRVVMSVFGPSVLTARALSTAAALGTAIVVFLLGKRLYGVVAGLGAATIIALAPGSVLVGRNIQIEATLGLVVALTALAWVTAMDEESVPWAVAAGCLAGLAVLTKMQGLVIVPALALAEVIRTRSFRRLTARTPLTTLLAFLAVGLPWNVWNLFQPTDVSALQTKAAELSMPDGQFLNLYFAGEGIWLLSPVLALALVAALVYVLRRHRPSDALVLLLVLVNVVFYMGYHHHTYYLYGALPFVALCIAALLEPVEMRSVSGSLVLLCVVALLLVPFALTELAGKKLGYWSSEQIASAAVAQGIDPAKTALAVSPALRGSWEPALRLYGRGMRIVSNPLEDGDPLYRGERLIVLDAQPRPASADSTPLIHLSDEHVMPVFFGYGVDQSHDALFYFTIDRPLFIRVGPLWTFGWTTRKDPMNYWASIMSPSFTEVLPHVDKPPTPGNASR
jgi:4-amino-4-deoxy-L-arabinose transferase-like glycosyltransferase